MTPRRLPAALPLVLLVLLTSLNLRPVASTIGPLLPELQAELGMDNVVSGVLATLPPLCFAVFGSLTPALSRRFGQMSVIMMGMAVLAVGLAVRALAADAWVFLLFSMLAIAGVAVANVLLPAVVGHAFPGRVERMTALYSIALTGAATLAAASAVPLAGALGSWRWGLGIWALLAVAALLSAARNRVSQPARSSAPRLLPPLRRSRIARGLAVYMAVNATTAYVILGWLPQIFRDAGIPAGTSGLMLAVALGLAAPVALFLPGLIARLPDQRPLVWAFCLSALAAYAGLLLAPGALAWPCAILLGLNGAGFPLALTMIGLRARTQEGVTRLSSFTQSMGYLMAIPGPVLIGVLYQYTGGWELPILFLAVLVVPQLALGLHAARRGTVEDELTGREACVRV
ncbi:MFS transporter [Actinocorallia populi]|uniref:MFS transporter n=1 Tax=Actinocorallia populi TaxID=2079200 RepID=UPI001300AFDF|nr:MFS transporter [Actinocorallia populi]